MAGAAPALCLTLLSIAAVAAAATEEIKAAWPRRVDHPKASITVYQPQIDDYSGTTLKCRSAVAVTPTGKSTQTFGAVWMEAKVEVDRDTRLVSFSSVKVTRVRFPAATPDQEKQLGSIIEDAAPKWDNTLDYDHFVAGIAALRQSQQAQANLRNDPPDILYENSPAMLLIYDGEPQSREIQGTKIKRIVNTPSIVLLDPDNKTWYLYGGQGWFAANEPMGPWKPATQVTADVANLVKDMEAKAEQASKAQGAASTKDDEKYMAEQAKKENPKYDPSKPPRIIAVSKPTELVLFDGEAAWKPLVEGELLYANNTSSDLIMEVDTQKYFLLISGRWFQSDGLKGPWKYVRSDALPPTFKKIPETSDKGNLLAHVAGTPQADEALADANTPEIAAVKRGQAKVSVTYDGEPHLEPISDTDLFYAKNTAQKVLKAGAQYYLCESGVWYVASDPKGPWEVAESVPKEIQDIPPDSPVYNVKYVYVYDTTPEYVYVGYTPAYLGCYPYYGTVVWGTGYPYTPWIGSIYYPWAWTYGFNAHYNPWYGWSFGFSIGYAWGWGSISFGFPYYGWGGYYPPYWGAGGFYPIYRPPYYPGNRPPYYGNRPTPYYGSGNWPGAGGGGVGASQLPAGGAAGARPSQLPAGGAAGARPSQLPAGGGSAGNLYQRPSNMDKVASGPGGARPSQLPTYSGVGGRNNVYTNDAGDVYRRNSNGSWDKQTGSGWKPSQGGSGAGPSTRPAPSQGLQRDYSSRYRGASRAGGYRGGGGGGGRRR